MNVDTSHPSIPYTMGSMENPTPRTVSLLKHPNGDSTQGVLLKEDIVTTLKFINSERSSYRKMISASINLVHSMDKAASDELNVLLHRWQEVVVLCQVQLVKRESLKYNTELQRSFVHGTVNNINIKRKMVRPEHFERVMNGTTSGRKKGNEPLHAPRHPAPASLVNRNKGITSPWEGSQFKLEILLSLRVKLLKKLVLYAFRSHVRRFQRARQCATTCLRSRLRRLMQLCFSSILFEALSSKYIAFAASLKARKLQLRTRAMPVLCALQALVIAHSQEKRRQASCIQMYRRNRRREGWRLLLWNAYYSERSRRLRCWAGRFSTQHCTLRALTAWIAAFVKKNQLRQQIHQRIAGLTALSESVGPVPSSPCRNSSSAVKKGGTPPSSLQLNVTFSPLKVLEQTPLQNLRGAVCFFADAVATGRRGLQTAPGPAAASSSSDEGMEGRGQLLLSGKCQGALHAHTMSALQQLRTVMTPVARSGTADGAMARQTAVTPLTADTHSVRTSSDVLAHDSSVLLPHSMRSLLRSCVTARKLFPQDRFAMHSPSSSERPAGSNSSSSNGSNGNAEGGGEGLRAGGISPISGVSSVWAHRHARRERCSDPLYLPSRSADPDPWSHSRTSYQGMQDLLLGHNTSPTVTHVVSPIRTDRTPHHRPSPATVARKNSTRLVERVISESFQLSSPPLRPRNASTQQSDPDETNFRAGADAYFKKVSSTGAFCGEVEVDSDIDMVLVERVRATGIGVGTQRAMLQRQYVEQIQSAFQLIKFRWLVRSCRRFVRVLHRQAQRQRRGYQCHRLGQRCLRAVCMRRWVALFQRRLTTVRLCTQVYEVKLSRSVLGAWREQAITRLLPAATQTAALVMRNTAKRAFCSWRQLLLLRAYQMQINEKLLHSKKRRILGVWKSYIGALRRQKKVFGAMARRALQPIFQRWRSKYQQRTLLCRVFALQQHAWKWRHLSTPTPFQRIYSTYTAWAFHTKQCVEARREVALENRARIFRGASLLATHFHLWTDFARQIKRTRKHAEVRQRCIKHSCFESWLLYVRCMREKIAQMRHSVTVTSPMRRVLRAWQHLTVTHCICIPTMHRDQSLMRRAFDFLHTRRPLRQIETHVLPLCDRHRMRASLAAWCGLLQRRNRYLLGLQLLHRVWWRIKRRLAFLTWPGRRQCLLARQMQQYLTSKHRDRIRLVECAKERRVVEVVSFVSKRRPTLAQRAADFGFILNTTDAAGLGYYTELCATLLQAWQAEIKRSVSLRMRGFAVRAALQQRCLRFSMMKWVLTTPRTSYRRVVWMVKPPRRAHDDHQHRRMLLREYSTRTAPAGSKNKDRSGLLQQMAKTQVDEDGNPLLLPDGTYINRQRGAAVGVSRRSCEELGEYYSDEEEGEYVLQRAIVT